MALKAVGTKKVCKTGVGQAIYLDKSWGFAPGDIVTVKVELARRGNGDTGTGSGQDS